VNAEKQGHLAFQEAIRVQFYGIKLILPSLRLSDMIAGL